MPWWQTLLSVGFGTVLGALLSYIPGLRQDRRADRAAKRLADYELTSALHAISHTLETPPSREEFEQYRETFMPTEAWRENRPLLAGTLRDEATWLSIVLAFRKIESLRIEWLHEPPTIDDYERLREIFEEIEKAVAGLQRTRARLTLRTRRRKLAPG